MASEAPDVKSTCLICFETRALKIVGNCKHSFCTECLSIVLDSFESESNTFACPSCKVDCLRPWDGVNGLVDFTGNTVDAVDTNTEHVVAPTQCKKRESSDASCDLCNHRQAKVPAANVCKECCNLHICKDCTKKHHMNKATQGHLLTPLLTKCEKELVCKLHHKELLSFCKTCAKPVCVVCVSLDHGDHDVEKLADTIRSKVEEVKVTLRLQEEALKDAQFQKRELTVLKEIASVVDKQDILIKEIEEEAQKRIDEFVKHKKDLKQEVEQDYKVVRDIPVALEDTSEAVVKLQEPINRAIQLLSENESNPDYLDKLTTLQLNLEASAKQWKDVEVTDYRADLIKLYQNGRRFIPDPPKGGLGTLNEIPREYSSPPREIFRHKMLVDSQNMYIPSIACLSSKYFAVSHPVKPGRLSDAVDIYEFPGTLKRTLRDQVFPIYDISSTPDSKLAILSDGTDAISCCVKLFNAVTGFISATCNISIGKPLSLGVTENYQYVLLGYHNGRMQITVTDTKGKQEYAVTEDKVMNPNMIACGGRFIFVKGDKGTSVSVYQIRDRLTGLQLVTSCSVSIGFLMSILATPWEDFFIVRKLHDDYYIDVFQGRKKMPDWVRNQCTKITMIMENADEKITRLCTKDCNTIAMAAGQTIKVFKWN